MHRATVDATVSGVSQMTEAVTVSTKVWKVRKVDASGAATFEQFVEAFVARTKALVVGEDGERLAKRHGALSLGELRERGVDPRAVVALLAALSGLDAGPRIAARDLVEGFTLAAIPRAPAVLRGDDVARLAAGAAAPGPRG